MSLTAIPKIHIDVLEEQHILGISYRLKWYMEYIKKINISHHEVLKALFNTDTQSVLDILNIIKILITIDLTTNAVLRRKIKDKLTEYLRLIRLDQRHDFEDPGRCIPKFSYNTALDSLSYCDHILQQNITENITKPVNK